MNHRLIRAAVLSCTAVIALSAGVDRAAAQGPAGSGAAEAQQNSSRGIEQYNPMRLLKKDSQVPLTAEERARAEQKLTPALQSQGLLAAKMSATEACEPFVSLEGCLAALHASHSVGINFICVRAVETGVNTTSDVSGCKAMDSDRAYPLQKTIQILKPDANAKQAAKDAELQAKNDLSGVSTMETAEAK
jgi:hypothetical protein